MQAVVEATAPKSAAKKSQFMDFDELERDYGLKKSTAYVWASSNRYGFGNLVVKFGSRSKIRRSDFERWLESRKSGGNAA